MASAISRQIKLQSSINHMNILGTFSVQGNTFIDKPDDTLANYIFNTIDKNNINNILEIMYKIAGIVEYLHSEGIAHGDVTLQNLFVKDNNVVLSGFERFSILKAPNISLKKFNFTNSICYAPEIRRPLDQTSATNATFCGDVYSLGMVFSVILFHLSHEQFDIARRCILRYRTVIIHDFFEFARQQKLNKVELPEIHSYNPALYLKRMFTFKIDTSTINTKNNPFLKYLLGRYEYPSSIIKELTNIIDDCHATYTPHRPSATNIKQRLHNILTRDSIAQ
jgi:serine/threonine protein kinase